jgi:mannose-6-phosphate isomerase-like protein (cupin superfamily)
MQSLQATHLDAAVTWFADEAGAVATAPSSPARGPAMAERSARAGQMAPLYTRDETETYRVVAGEVTFFVGSEVVHAREGDVVVAAAGAARTLRAESDDARWIVLTRVSSFERYLDFGRAVARPLDNGHTGWPSASELAAISAIAAANGIDLLGPPGALPSSR